LHFDLKLLQPLLNLPNLKYPRYLKFCFDLMLLRYLHYLLNLKYHLCRMYCLLLKHLLNQKYQSYPLNQMYR